MMLGPTVDMIWVGRLGPAAIAGVGVSGMVVMLLISLMMGFNMGTRAMIARFVGAGDADNANHVALQAYVACAGFALVIVPSGIFFAEPLLSLFGLEADVIAEGIIYMRLMFIGAGFMSFWLMSESIMQASGDSSVPMKISVLYRCVHLVLCPFLIFGWGIIPGLGIAGAALSNIISQMLGLCLGLWVLFGGHTRLKLTLNNFRIDGGIIWRIVKIGIPASIAGMQRTLGQLVLMRFVAPFGTYAVAAHTLCQRVEIFVMMPGMGLGMGAGVLAGQNLGAQQPKRAAKGSWLASGLVTAFLSACAVIILIWPQGIIRIFSLEPGVVDMAAVFLRIMAVGFFIFGFEPVLMNSLNQVGDTIPPMIISIVSFWGIQIPLAYLLPHFTDLGVFGIRWGMVTGMILSSASLAVYFRTGRWQNKKI